MPRLKHGLTLLCAAASLACTLRSERSGAVAPRPAPLPAVVLAKVEQAQGLRVSRRAEADEPSYLGVILPAQATDVAAPHAGAVDKVYVTLGDRVQEGQLLVGMSVEQARLERVRAEAERSAAEAAFARAQVEQQHAGAEAVRAGQLEVEGLMSKEAAALARFKQRQSRILTAEAESVLKEKRARADQLRALEQDADVRASFAGRVAARYVDPGASVARGAPLLRLIGEDQLILRFAIPEGGEPAGLRLGQRVQGEGTDQRFHGTVVRVAPEIDSASRMRVVEATLEDPQQLTAHGLIGSIVSVHALAAADRAGESAAGRTTP